MHETLPIAVPPTRFEPMAEIEVGFVPVDVVVTHGRSGRPLGRPVMTVAVCASTGMVAGFRVSFGDAVASDVVRCLAHAFGPKDVSSLGTSAAWPSQGVPRRVLFEDSPQLRSRSLAEAAGAFGFTVCHMPSEEHRNLLARGRFERLYLDWIANLGASPSADEVPASPLQMSVAEFEDATKRWIVDDYHALPILPCGSSPLVAWRAGVADFPVRLAEPDRLAALRSRLSERPIGKLGITSLGVAYWHERLDELRRTHGRERRYIVRLDPDDLSSVHLREPDGTWLKLDSNRPLPDGFQALKARTRLYSDVRTALDLVS